VESAAPSASDPRAHEAVGALARGAERLAERVRTHRRELHRQPELAFAEHRTAAYIEATLDHLGVAHRRVLGTGVVAHVPGEGPRCVGVRADMDALPVQEAPGRTGYRSQVPGVSHACGHDAHVAMALGLAELATLHPLPGTLALYFQPAEEGSGGAAPMVEAGVLEAPRPEAVLAIHVSSGHPSGTIALRQGPMTASADSVDIVVRGVGGHAAHPHTAVDPVPVAAQIVLALQQIVTREIAPAKPALITVGRIRGGTKANVIAPSVELGATVRAVHPEIREHLLERIGAVASGIAAVHRAEADVAVERGFQPGANDPRLATLVGDAAHQVAGPMAVRWEDEPSLGAEDFFAFGSTGVPVTMLRLGVANPARGIAAPHHSPHFDLDEAALPRGVAVLAASAWSLLTGGLPQETGG
jgi:amidohydrolase